MLIRSQNRKFLVSMEQTAVEYRDEVIINTEKEGVKETQHNLYIKSTKMYSLIGGYSTEEKAIKVLDMIQNAYLSRMVMVFCMPKDEEVVTDTNVGDEPDGHYGCDMNGQHEKCNGCCLVRECKHAYKHWYKRYFTAYRRSDEE